MFQRLKHNRIYSKKFVASLVVVGLIFVLFLAGSVINAVHQETVTGYVTDKYVKNTHDGDGTFYLVVNNHVIENTDNIFYGKINSADKQAQAKVGHKVKVETRGYRIPMFSIYPNVVSVVQE